MSIPYASVKLCNIFLFTNTWKYDKKTDWNQDLAEPGMILLLFMNLIGEAHNAVSTLLYTIHMICIIHSPPPPHFIKLDYNREIEWILTYQIFRFSHSTHQRRCDVPGSLGACTLVPFGEDPSNDCPTCSACNGNGVGWDKKAFRLVNWFCNSPPPPQTCAFVSMGKDPKDNCPFETAETCGLIGSCDGFGRWGGGVAILIFLNKNIILWGVISEIFTQRLLYFCFLTESPIYSLMLLCCILFHPHLSRLPFMGSIRRPVTPSPPNLIMVQCAGGMSRRMVLFWLHVTSAVARKLRTATSAKEGPVSGLRSDTLRRVSMAHVSTLWGGGVPGFCSFLQLWSSFSALPGNDMDGGGAIKWHGWGEVQLNDMDGGRCN